MLHALLHGKLDRWLVKDAHSIEDLLTSVVLGSAAYAPAEQALLPFLGKASDREGTLLSERLGDVVDIDLSFWPRWTASEDLRHDADDDFDDDDDDGLRVPVKISAAEPEVVIVFTHARGQRSMVLIEAKLHSGKSSHAIDETCVNDQLAKYWLHLEQRAKAQDAVALGLIYLTATSKRPREDLEASANELSSHGHARAPLYWLSWRSFCDVVDEHASPILRDCAKLLRECWNLVPAEVGPWPSSRALPPPFRFCTRFRWPSTPLRPTPWTFKTTPS